MEIFPHGFRRDDARGTLTEVLNTGTWASVLHGSMRAQSVMGHHFHKTTDVVVYLMTGRASVVTVDVLTGHEQRGVLLAGEGVWLGVNVSHAIRFDEDSSIILLKSRPYDQADPDTFPHPVAF